MMFRASAPVTASAFHDRKRELVRVGNVLESLAAGTPKWLAILGPRKVGKTSLVLEAARNAPTGVVVSVLDAMSHLPLSLDVFRTLAVRALDALAADQAAGSYERRMSDPEEFRTLLVDSGLQARLPRTLRLDVERLPTVAATADAVRRWLELPEQLASLLGRKLVIAIDEIQELASLASRTFDPFPTMRSAWQRHEHVSYIISGSAPSMLRELVTSRHSPFFQHFDILDLGPFERRDAVALLVEESPRDRKISPELAERIVEVVGGNPFYLQLVGEAFTGEPAPYDLDSLKPVLQALLFSRVGRLSLYFQNEYDRLVGRATTSAATLEALALGGPQRLVDVAKRIGASTASTARYLERVGDAVRHEGASYSIADPLFALWLRWRSPGGTTVPMSVVGSEAELATAAYFSALGFDLVYQSRASRGAFDLLAIRGHHQLGCQVKRTSLPVRFSKREWQRMTADAKRWGWRWVIAVVDPDGAVHVLDPARAKHGREVRLDERAAIPNVLAWIDA